MLSIAFPVSQLHFRSAIYFEIPSLFTSPDVSIESCLRSSIVLYGYKSL